jgi:UDP-3-O-[3-hydroxymyristoyl] glucosamine N-acyltransferase
VEPVRLGEIVAALGGELKGDPAHLVARIASLETAGPEAISFLAQEKLRPQLEATQAGAVIVAPALADSAPAGCQRVLTEDPYLYFARLTQWWAARARPAPAAGIHASAVIEEGAVIHPTASVGAFVHVGAGARIGAHVRLGAQAHVGAGARIGDGSLLHPHATVAHGCVLGARNVLQSGAVVGGDGFGFAPMQGRWERIEQLGAVVTGDDCDIGASTCVDRGALDDTVLGNGVKLDNLIQIAHNCRIGDHTAMAACVGIAGSVKVGRHCMFGGAAMINGHIEICDHVFVSGGTLVSSSIKTPGRYTGVFPFEENSKWEKNAATLRQLHKLRDRIRALEKKS